MRLTPREYQIVRLYALGWTYDRIARELRIGKRTVFVLRGRALARADVGSMPELWAALGWLRVPGMTAPAIDSASVGAGAHQAGPLPEPSLRRIA